MLGLKTSIWFNLPAQTHPSSPKPRAFDILLVLGSEFKAGRKHGAARIVVHATKVRSALHQSRQTSYQRELEDRIRRAYRLCLS